MTEVSTSASTQVSTEKVVLLNSTTSESQHHIRYNRPTIEDGISEIAEFDCRYQCCCCNNDDTPAVTMIDLVELKICGENCPFRYFAVCNDCYLNAICCFRNHYASAYEWVTRRGKS